jgi:hypothetical protein
VLEIASTWSYAVVYGAVSPPVFSMSSATSDERSVTGHPGDRYILQCYHHPRQQAQAPAAHSIEAFLCTGKTSISTLSLQLAHVVSAYSDQ